MLSSQRLLSLVELPTLEVPGGGVTAGLTTARSQVRLLLRDLSGKACWDASILYCSPEDSTDSSFKYWAPGAGGFDTMTTQHKYLNYFCVSLIYYTTYEFNFDFFFLNLLIL